MRRLAVVYARRQTLELDKRAGKRQKLRSEFSAQLLELPAPGGCAGLDELQVGAANLQTVVTRINKAVDADPAVQILQCAAAEDGSNERSATL